MSKDGLFYKQLHDIFQSIFEDKNLVIARKYGRTDFREVDYSLPDFSARSVRGLDIIFLPQAQGENLSERWERLHRHEYAIYCNETPIAHVQRLPAREVIFFTKPYDSRERFVDNALRNAISNFDSVKQSFEPGMAGGVR